MIEKRFFTVFTEKEGETEEENKDIPCFVGKAIVYDTETKICDGVVEKIARNAFEHSANTDDIRCLFNHDPNLVLGRTKNGTLKLKKQDDGIYFHVSPPNTDWAKNLVQSVKRGDITQCSFSFTTDDEDFSSSSNGNVCRTIRDGKLFDVSIVTYPVYEETIVHVRKKVDAFRQKQEIETKITKFLEERKRNERN